jgi:TolB-like protein
MTGVFVSYAREDAATAQVVAATLEEAGFEVWFDQRIHSGSEFSREIEAALTRAGAVVVLWSRSSIESAWVRDEAAEGRDSGRLVSVLLDDCRPPIGFRQFQTTDLSGWSGRGRSKQIDNVIAAVRAKGGAAAIHAPKPAARRSPRPFAWGVGAAAVVAILVAAFFLWRGLRDEPAAPLSLALLPFTADSSDPEARKLAGSIYDALAHTLSHGAFSVTTADGPSQPGSGDYRISGQVSTTADKVIASVRMQDAARNIVVFSHQFELGRNKAAEFPELVGAQVASQLSWTAPLLAMERRHPSEPSIVAGLLQSSSAGLDSVGTLHDFENSRRLAARAAKSPLAQNSFAFNAAFVLPELPASERAAVVKSARRAADRSVELAPEFGDNYTPWCLLRSEQRKVQCEDRLRAAMRTDPDSPFANWFLAYLVLNPAGRNDEAAEIASLSLAHDQYMPYKIGLMLRLMEATGRTGEAADLYRQSTRWWPGSDAIRWFRLSGMMQRGDFDAMRKFSDESGGERSPVLLAVGGGSAPAIRKACSAADGFDGLLCMLALARTGDLDTAFAFADRLYPARRGRTGAEEERIWLRDPAPISVAFLTGAGAAPMRRDSRYLPLAERVGLLEYWRSGRPPDFCRQRSEPICRKLLARG